MKLSFGHADHDFCEIDVVGYERAPVGEPFDDNWLVVKIRVRAGGFDGKVNATILTGELSEFLGKLRPLYESLRGSAEYTTLEEQLRLQLTGDGKGHLELCGEVCDRPGIGNRLHFKLHFDQSQLRSSIQELEKIVLQFPER